MRMREMTEAERRTLRAGLRIIAQLIARRYLARQAAEAGAAGREDDTAGAAAGGAQEGTER